LITGDTMDNQIPTELNVGLSEEEKEDLEKLIKEFKSEQPVSISDITLEDVQGQIRSMGERLAQLSEMLLQSDTRLKSLYTILRLSYQKSEDMNERIDAIIKSITGMKNI
jgi:Mg2+ and Co2+ transporter CorA